MWAIKPGHVLTCHNDWERDTSRVFTAKTSITDQELPEGRTIAKWVVRLHLQPLVARDIQDMDSET